MAELAASRAGFEVSIDSQDWDAASCEALVERCLAACESRIGPLGAEVSVLFTDDAAMREMNARFRGIDKPTNVLSFPGPVGGPAAEASLGDIAIARGVCENEARAGGRSVEDHVAHMLVHGLLHLIGYDHQTHEDAEKMELLEIAILAEAGIDDPYRDGANVFSDVRNGAGEG